MIHLLELIPAIILCSQSVHAVVPQPTHSHNPSYFDWSSITPSRDIEWSKCYGNFKCTRLQVPLDWNATEDTLYDRLATLAIVKVPARVPITDPSYAGFFFTNPGGPGGSGVLFTRDYGRWLQKVVESDKHWDVLGVDPRGIYKTRPQADCFDTPKSRDEWLALLMDEGMLDEGDRAIDMQLARAQALGKQCAKKDFGKYVSTAYVARDMIEIADKVEKARQKELLELGATSHLMQQNNSPPLVNYLGFSYGTMLGNTFASIYPDRVGRFILDGVVNAPDYVAEAWKKNLQDTDLVFKRCCKYCFEAGPSKCPIYNSKGGEAIERDILDQLESLKRNPVPIATSYGSPIIATYAQVKYFLFSSLYDPTTSFPALAEQLAQMRKGNYSSFVPNLQSTLEVECPVNGHFAEEASTQTKESTPAIMCGDGDVKTNQTKSEFKKYLGVLESQSTIAGAWWATLRLGCMGWQVRPRWRFTGPFTTKTATPILWMGNTADPVTPSANTISMAALHPGSGVLIQESEGHAALFSAAGHCTNEVARKYMSTGKVAEGIQRCPAAYHPFQPIPGENKGYFDEELGEWVQPPRWRRSFR